MKQFVLERKQFVEKPIEEVFSFFSKPENLEKITPPFLKFQILTPPPIEMKTGALIEYRLKVRGIGLHWITQIESYDPPNKFTDSQLKGPYKRWHHTHQFRSIQNGTEMVDRIEYALPLGFLGGVLNALFVKHDLKKIFDYRYQVIDEVFSG